MILYFMLAITDHDRGETMAEIFRSAGLQTMLTMPASGTASTEHLSLYGLQAKAKTVIGAVAAPDEERQIMRLAKRRLFIDVPGHGIIMSVPIKSVAGGRTLAYLSDSKETGGKPSMEFENELIIAILNEGFSDVVMNAARGGGARGGTVIHAKETGAKRAEKFLGVSLADEKDMVFIAVSSRDKAEVMRRIMSDTGPETPAGAICFSLPISSVAGMRMPDDEE